MSEHARAMVGAVMVRESASRITVAYEQILAPQASPGELIIAPSLIGICGSDLEQLHGRMPSSFRINFPHTLGHEWVGIVEEVGAGVEGFAIGDRVLGHGHLGGNDWFGVTHDGAMADLFAVPAAMCFHVPASVGDRTAAVIEPFACVVEAIRKLGGISAGDLVHVHGLGAIGMCAVAQAAAAGARVTAFDPSGFRRERAAMLGAAEAVESGTQAALEKTGEATVSIEASGNPSAMMAALESAGSNGRVLFLGVSQPREAPARLGLIQARNLSVISSLGAPVEIWPQAIRFVEQAGIDLSPIVTAVLPLEECDAGIARAQSPETDIKILLSPAKGGKDNEREADID